MPLVSLSPPVISTDLDITRVQQRYDPLVQQLIQTPWGSGVLVTGANLKAQTVAGSQIVTVSHGLGRRATGAVVWNCSQAVFGAAILQYVDANTCTVSVYSPGALVAGTIDLWVG